MRYFILFLLYLNCNSLYGQDPDTIIVKGQIFNDYISVYKDQNGVTKLGEIPKGNGIYLLAPGNDFYYYVYGNQITGFAPKSFIMANKGLVNLLTKSNIEWKEKRAKVLEYNDNLKAQKVKTLSDALVKSKSKRDSLFYAVIFKKTSDAELKYKFTVSQLSMLRDAFGVGVHLAFSNFATKTIKYTYVTVGAYNAVDDLITSKTLTCIGPIEPKTEGEYNHENVFISHVVNHLKITKIRVQYMDKSERSFVGKDLDNLNTYLFLDLTPDMLDK